MMTANNPFQRLNGRQQNQVGAATTGQYSSPAGTVTPPVTQQGGGAGFQQMQAPGITPNSQQGNALGGVMNGVGQIGGLLGMMNGNGQLTPGQNKVLGGAGMGGAIGSMFGAPGAAIGAGLGALGSLF
jgi:hypothetical protein